VNRRARAMAAFCVITLTCGASVLAGWRLWELASTRQKGLLQARRYSELQAPSHPVAAATPDRTDSTRGYVAPRPPNAVAARSKSIFSTGLDEQPLMRLLRNSRGNDPALAIELAREGNRRFPGSPDAPERASLLIHALAEEGLSSEARGEAEDMVNRYPDSDWVHEVEQFTGARRHRSIEVGPNGELRYADLAPPSRG
jgi:hypothetical protein